MEEKLIHYKWGGTPTHADVSMLPNGNDIEYIVIDHIEARENEKINGQTKNAFVAVFQKNPYTELGMVLNKKNKEILLKLARKGEWELLTIKNLPVRLTKENTSLGYGLRISKLPAKMPSQPTPAAVKKHELTEDKVASAIEFLKTKSMDELKQFYNVSEEMERRLTEPTPTQEDGK